MCRGYFLSIAVNFKQVPGKHKANYADGLVHEVSIKHACFLPSIRQKNKHPPHLTPPPTSELALELIGEAESHLTLQVFKVCFLV